MTGPDLGARSYGRRVALFYAASFVTIGLHMPFFPVVLAGRGLSEAQIGLVLAAPLFVRIPISPTVAYLADRSGNHARVLVALSLGTCLGFSAFLLVQGFAGALAAACLLALFWVTVMPLAEAIALAGVRQHGLDYGRMRVWGSLAFIGANVIGGHAVGFAGPEAALWLMIAAAAIACAAASQMPRPASGDTDRKSALPRPSEAGALLKSRPFVLLIAATSCINGSHAIMYTFGSLHWQSQGISPATIGALWAVGVAAEVALFAVAGRLLAQVAPATLLIVSAGAALLRWTLTALDPPLALLFPIQALHGLSFGAMHLGTMQMIVRIVPERLAGTAQGLYSATTVGIAMGTLMAASGLLYAALAGHAYLVMAGLAGLGLAAALLLGREQSQRTGP